MKPSSFWRHLRVLPAAALIRFIRLYRVSLSGWLGGQCRYHPTCSHYGEEAIAAHGALRGSAMAIWRVLRCNPFGSGGFEPVSLPSKYEHVIPNRPVTQESTAASNGTGS
jgi:uncharacterized protein